MTAVGSDLCILDTNSTIFRRLIKCISFVVDCIFSDHAGTTTAFILIERAFNSDELLTAELSLDWNQTLQNYFPC